MKCKARLENIATSIIAVQRLYTNAQLFLLFRLPENLRTFSDMVSARNFINQPILLWLKVEEPAKI